ncbi:Pre-mRNA-splicing factor cwf16 [Yarrowia sp. C11]|nr:Pre-mRNA-splicing factor cwf16 [Yarrowia sp. E02]KAG5372592.1 Pre-mRNA-splicing factor cwf16 [Yarrowia sp. C11]
MSDRKGINKYYPPDFDPSKLERRVKKVSDSKSATMPTVRLMLPFSMRCTACGEYIYKSKKFNARKQVTDEVYLDLKIIRFFIRCPRCSGEIRFKTDPKNSDYQTEYGAVRNYDPTRDEKKAEETLDERLDRLERDEKELEELKKQGKAMPDPSKLGQTVTTDGDVMAEIEARQQANIDEQEGIERLEELKERTARLNKIGRDVDVLEELRKRDDKESGVSEQDLLDDELAKEVFRNAQGDKIKRLEIPKVENSVKKVSKPVIKVKKRMKGIVRK